WCSTTARWWRKATVPLPAEEAVGVVPFFRHVEVQAVEPPGPGAPFPNPKAETVQDRRGPRDSHVRRQAGDETGGAAEGPFEVQLLVVGKLPGNELAENDVGVLGFRQDAVADHRGPCGDEGEVPRVAVVDVRRPDPGQQGVPAGGLKV